MGSSSDDEYLYTVYTINPKQPLTKTIVENTAIDVIVDSGASVSIMDETAYTKLQDKVQLQRANIKICTYGSRTALPLLGKFCTTVSNSTKIVPTVFYIAKGHYGLLLSCQTATELGLLKIINSVSHTTPKVHPPFLESLLTQHANIFEGIGKLKDFQVKSRTPCH
ncbi:hypothetical protein EOD39_10254 [Acipenser ruthenus]|uniref:Peptidase A2 domain-containing protein n=1 Tax=Acipenser ruthenus TaxID=7906 RepID=A0A662YU00_ACIRT|nr:hypothetical protein EOD39_10254 [Acipenser ruthenus]